MKLLFTTLCCFVVTFLSAQTASNKTDKAGRKTGEWIYYLNKDYQYITVPDTAGFYRIAHYKKGKITGLVAEYDYHGTLLSEITHTSLNPDTLNGPGYLYFPSGKKRQEIFYTNGELNGICRINYESGAVQAEISYVYDIQEGTYKEYYENGTLKREGTLHNNKKDGHFIFYFPDGKISEERDYKNDLRDGITIKYTAAGTKKYEYPYLKGNRQGVATIYDSVSGEPNEYKLYWNDTAKTILEFIPYLGDFVAGKDTENGIPATLAFEEYIRKQYKELPILYSFALLNVTEIYFIATDEKNTLAWAEKYLSLAKSLEGTENEQSANDWHLLSIMFFTYDKQDDAVYTSRIAFQKSLKDGKPTETTLAFLSRTADVYFTKKDPANGIVLYDSLLTIAGREKEFTEQYVDYGIRYAQYLTDYDAYDQAADILTALEQKTAGTEMNYQVLYQKGAIYSATNKTDEMMQAFSSINDSFGKSHRDTIIEIDVLRDLAGYATETGNYAAAEKYYMNLTGLAEKYSGGRNSFYYNYVDDLADYYDVVGRYDQSVHLREDLVNYYKSQIGNTATLDFLLDSSTMRTLYIHSLTSYANSNAYAGNNAVAGEYYHTAADAAKYYYGDTSFDYMRSLSALAGWETDEDQFADAERDYKEVIRLSGKYFQNEDVNYYTWLDNLSELYFRMQRYDEALALADTVYRERLQEYKEGNPVLTASYGRLAEIYEAKGNYEQAYQMYKKDMDIRIGKLNEGFSVMNENEKEKYLATFRYRFDEFASFSMKHVDSIHEISSDLLRYTLANQSMLLFSSATARKSLTQSADPELRAQYQQWLSLRQMINRYETTDPGELKEKNISLDSLHMEAQKIEKNLALSSDVTHSIPLYQASDIRKKLKPGEAYIQFLTIPDYQKEGSPLSYAALISRPDSNDPAFVPLCSEDSLLFYLKRKTGENDQKYVDRVYGFPEGPEDENYFSGQHLYRLLLEPVLKNLHDVSTIFISPAGNINKLNAAALPLSSTRVLSDNYRIFQISSVRTFMDNEYEVAFQPQDTIALFGGIDYAATDEQLLAANKNMTHNSAPAVAIAVDTATVRGGSWKYLPATLNEIKTISGTLQPVSHHVVSYSGTGATEDVFKSLSDRKNHFIIHIATHGFFMTDSANVLTKNIKEKNDISLYNSGILLAGGARTWKGQKPAEGLDDGILTAAEVSNLDLTNCDLVVLSACETGLGTIQNDEGVFGLQRAFRIAGVQNMIMSLWQVSDKETSLFMQTFYKNWSSGKSLQQAFADTQKTMRTKYSPYYWAAFILIQ